MLLDREYFINCFNQNDNLDSAYQSCLNVIHIVPVSRSEKEKLHRILEEVYLHFKHIKQNSAAS